MILECRELTVQYGVKTVLSNFTLHLERGKIYGLLGENGSGKTTWMKTVAGLLRNRKGEIIYNNHLLDFRDKKEIAYMATESFFYDYMRIRDVEQYYVDFFSDFDRERFADLLARMNLSSEEKIRNLSSGMNAKVRLAATLSRRASLCLLDEPLNGVDYKAKQDIINLILEEADDQRTFVISTHLLEEVESYIDYAVFIRNGKLVDKINLEAERMRSNRSLAEIYMDLM